MTKHEVKCLYCSQIFDINKEEFVKPRVNRYAHKSCYDKLMADTIEKEEADEKKTDEVRQEEKIKEVIAETAKVETTVVKKIPKKVEIKEERPTPAEDDFKQLIQYIKVIYDIDIITPYFFKQIKEFHEKYNYSYLGILKTLKYWHEVKGKSVDTNYGIAIVPYVYEQAKAYYKNLYDIAQINMNKEFTVIKKNVKISPPEMKNSKIRRLFTL